MSSDEKSHAGDRTWIENEAGTSNDIVLSDCEVQTAKSLLGEIQGELDHLSLEILQLNTILDNLYAQRKASLARADRVRTALAPHKRLPTEILSTIFVLSMDSCRPLFFPGNHREIWPWPLRMVCSRWRQVAISDSDLWDSLAFLVFEWYEDQGKNVCNIFRSIVQNCTTAPSQLQIHVSDPNPSVVDSVRFQPFDLLAVPQLSSRIIKLDLLLSVAWFMACTQSSSALNFPCLESLSLTVYLGTGFNYLDDAETDPIPTFPKTNFFDEMHVLRKLKIQFIPKAASMVNITLQIPWHQLTDLDLSELTQTASCTLQLLRLCKRLVECRIQIGSPISGDDINIEIEAALPDLERLTVIADVEVAHFFARLAVPSLSEFRITTEYKLPLSDITSMIRRSRASLRILYVHCVDGAVINAVGLEVLLAEMDSLVEISGFCLFPRSTLKKISRGELLPCLEVWKCNLPGEEFKVFLSALEDGADSRKLREVWGSFQSLDNDLTTSGYLEKLKELHGIEVKPYTF